MRDTASRWLSKGPQQPWRLCFLPPNVAGAAREGFLPPTALKCFDSSESSRVVKLAANVKLLLEEGRAAFRFSGTQMLSPVALIRLLGR